MSKKSTGITAAAVPAPSSSPPKSSEDLAIIERCRTSFQKIHTEMAKVIVGQQEVIEELLVAMFARGHCLLVGVPGLAKTLDDPHPGRRAAALDFSRIQFTPDLMPARHHRHRSHSGRPHHRRAGVPFLPGPIFANVMLADEINRTPPKTQAALLEAMQEHQVTRRRPARIS